VRLVVERQKAEGQIPLGAGGGTLPEESPEDVQSTYFCDELLNWDRGRQQVAEWAANPLADAHYGMFFRRAVRQLGAVYVLFGDLVATAVGVEPAVAANGA
jgi:hypothetical protein